MEGTWAGSRLTSFAYGLHGPASECLQGVLTCLARQAINLSNADVERLVREARAKARCSGRSLTHTELAARLAVGRPVRPREFRYRMAIHEAGHALVRRALKVGTEVGLSIEAPGGSYAESMLDVDVVQSKS